MKALGKALFTPVAAAAETQLRVAYERVTAAELGLRESWFRNAIFENPELVIGPCREAGRVPTDESWLPWEMEFGFGAGPVDVLLISSHGRPAIIETKLSSNPEKRREVVAQLMDYALSLQDAAWDDLPPLPASDAAPDPADVEDALSTGRFLLVVAGDALDPRALRLSEAVLASHLTSEWDLVMVDLNVYRPLDADGRLLIVPELRGAVLASTRQVVRVQVEGAAPRARLLVERLPSDSAERRRRPPLLSIDEFLECVRARSPNVEPAISRIVERFRQIDSTSAGRFVLGLQATTANIYWRSSSTGRLRRIFAISENGRFRIWLYYVLSEGREDVATTIRELSRPIATIADGETGGALLVSDSNVKGILEVVDEVVKAVAVM